LQSATVSRTGVTMAAFLPDREAAEHENWFCAEGTMRTYILADQDDCDVVPLREVLECGLYLLCRGLYKARVLENSRLEAAEQRKASCLLGGLDINGSGAAPFTCNSRTAMLHASSR
jgi:hypothetical protein